MSSQHFSWIQWFLDREYVILGSEDLEKKRLVVDMKSFVKQWTHGKHWIRHVVKMLRNKKCKTWRKWLLIPSSSHLYVIVYFLFAPLNVVVYVNFLYGSLSTARTFSISSTAVYLFFNFLRFPYNYPGHVLLIRCTKTLFVVIPYNVPV